MIYVVNVYLGKLFKNRELIEADNKDKAIDELKVKYPLMQEVFLNSNIITFDFIDEFPTKEEYEKCYQ